jgi:transposase
MGWRQLRDARQIRAFARPVKTESANHERSLAAIELGLSNSNLEGINSKVRLINHRGPGLHSVAALIAMIFLCCGGITTEVPMNGAPSVAR